MDDRVTGHDVKPGAPTIEDLTVTRRDAEVLEVSSWLTRGRCATVYKFSFSTNYSVKPFLIRSYMQGISTALILDAVHAYVERESAQKREAAYNAFLGHGCTMPSDAFAVTDEDAEEILELLREADPAAPVWEAGGYSICTAEDSESSSVLLFYDREVVGFYEGSCLWIDAAHRGIGLSTPLILAAAIDRGGNQPTVLPRDVEMHGYSVAGLAAHERAFDAFWAASGDLPAALLSATPCNVADGAKSGLPSPRG
jgi:hypothetical protein